MNTFYFGLLKQYITTARNNRLSITDITLSIIKKILQKTKKVRSELREATGYFINPLRLFRNNLYTNHPCALIVTHHLGGGSQYYLETMLLNKKNKGESFIVLSNHLAGYRVSLYTNKHESVIFSYSLRRAAKKMASLNISTIFLNNCVSFKDPTALLLLLTTIKKQSGASLTIPMHDFFMVCPSYTLLNEQNTFCDIPDNLQHCNACLTKNNYSPYKGLTMSHWRAAWQAFLLTADEIQTFSVSSKTLLLKAYPILTDRNTIRVIPHTLPHTHQPVITKKPGDKIRVGIVGDVGSIQKGSMIIKEMLSLIESKKLDIHITIIGSCWQLHESDALSITGQYQQSEMDEIIRKSNINVFFMPSIWPETFSYVTHELMQLSVPIACFKLGAQAEAISQYHTGYIIPAIDATTAIEHLIIFSKQLRTT